MDNVRRWVRVLAVTAAAGVATVSAATPAVAGVTDPKPITAWTSTVAPYDPTWVNLFWTTGRKVCDARVTVSAPDVDVLYPANTGDYTSFSRSDRLKPGHVDYTAVRVTAHYDHSQFVPLTVTFAYNRCGGYGAHRSETFELTLPVLEPAARRH